ncbi:SR-related and CTD-associated factor 4-like isoform X2 [Stigmatopora argus]
MEAVSAFNSELFSMNEMQPPISRAKMMAVTKLAIKAIKLFKHVVQIVEKFIKRCKPELKVPGLYVVDSIVRQSRHQFGVEKDVFGPRFLKNFSETFQNLLLCPEDDKAKIVRVLNLWQKNAMFDMDIIQPLMDMANEALQTQPLVAAEPQAQFSAEPPAAPPLSQMSDSDALAAVAQLFQSPHGHEIQRMLENWQQAEKMRAAGATNGPDAAPGNVPLPVVQEDGSAPAENLLGRFDYDAELGGEVAAPNPATGSFGVGGVGQMHNVAALPPLVAGHGHDAGGFECGGIGGSGVASLGERLSFPGPYHYRDESASRRAQPTEDLSSRRPRVYGGRSRSRSRSPRRRSPPPPRSRRRWGSRSRSADRRRRSPLRTVEERRRDRERRQKGLPAFKSKMLCVCTTTLWLGQLDKKTQESDVVSLLEEFGQIQSVNMIPPRGCAYAVMVHRLDAYTALNKLSRGSFKVNGKLVKVAWAFNKGLKRTHKKFWDVDQGVTYIPWDQVKGDELESYQDGGMLDPDTLKEEWKKSLELNRPRPETAVAVLPETTTTENGLSGTTGSAETPIQVPAGPLPFSPLTPPAMASAPAAFAVPLELAGNSTAVQSTSAEPHPPPFPRLGSPPLPPPPPFPRLGSPPPALSRLGSPPQPPPASPTATANLPPQRFLPPLAAPGGPPFPSERFRPPFPPRGPPFTRPEGATSPPSRWRFVGPPRHTLRGGW